MAIYENPVIRGFNPDPSICRVGNDFYLVTSTFEFFPGVPIYHSVNLVDWEMINCCLKTEKQLPLKDAWNSGGIYAPTIRYHDKTFYMTVTNVSGGGNFIVKTEDIYGEWSDPIPVDQGGIDPSIFFDDDGKVYYLSTYFDESLPEDKRAAIQISEINIDTGKIIRGPKVFHYGSGGRCVEGPHLYKMNGKYFLLLAEGGTEFGHMVTIFRSDSVYGDYEACNRNPILTHRNRPFSQFQCLGHADMTDDANGNLWLVCLGIRQIPFASMHHLGRETFLAPAKWGKDGFPIIGDNGTLSETYDVSLPGEPPAKNNGVVTYDLTNNNNEFLYIRNPIWENYEFSSNGVCLKGNGMKLSEDKVRPTFLGIRQKEFGTVFSAYVRSFSGICGISAYNNQNYHYDIVLEERDGKSYAYLRRAVHDMIVSFERVETSGKNITLRIRGGDTFYAFEIEENGTTTKLGEAAVAGLCSEGMMYMNFTGALNGLFSEQGEMSVSQIIIENKR